MFEFAGDVVACIGANSEPLDRLENASDVVGKERSVTRTSTEPQMNGFILSPLV